VTSHNHSYAALSRIASVDPPGGIATPFLAVDLDAMERNIRRMAEYFAGRRASVRPHLKHHKCTEIALLQLAAGASGMTCATSDEVAAAVGAGISDVLLANVVTDRARLASVAAAAAKAAVTIAVDSPEAAELASDAAVQHGVSLRVVVEVDIGMRRSGVTSADEAVALAKHLALLPGLVFWGVMAYEGHLVAIEDRAQRSAAVREAFAMIPELLADLDRAGFKVRMVTGGAASTFESAGNLPFMTDIQTGAYVLMDGAYSRLLPEFEPALAAISTVATSRPGRPLVIDVGAKRMSTDWGDPMLAGYQATRVATSEEHCRFLLSGTSRPQVGERVAVIPGHSCSTVSFHRSMFGFRGNRFERVLRVDARDQLAC